MSFRNIIATLFCACAMTAMADNMQDSVMLSNKSREQLQAKSLEELPGETLLPEVKKPYIPRSGEVEFFAGVELNYRDVRLDTQYEFLINLMPGMKWHMGKHFTFSAQAVVPVINDYGDYYSHVHINVLNISKEALLWHRLALKATVGVFSHERWGIDFKAMLPLARWVALEGQMAFTGAATTCYTWNLVAPDRFYGTLGTDFFIPKYKTQFRLIGGKFLNGDSGGYLEAMRHFTHCSVGIYGQYSDMAKYTNGFNMGFKVVMVVPPYKRKHRKVTFRPESNFRFTYNMNADTENNKWYDTDPEQNERHGWFSPDILPWGINTMYDFTEKESRQSDSAGKEVKR